MYASFLNDVAGDMTYGRQLLQKADELEDIRSQRNDRILLIFEGVTFVCYSVMQCETNLDLSCVKYIQMGLWAAFGTIVLRW